LYSSPPSQGDGEVRLVDGAAGSAPTSSGQPEFLLDLQAKIRIAPTPLYDAVAADLGFNPSVDPSWPRTTSC